MATIAEQLTELVNQKNALADNLVTKGIEASQSETFNTLVPKVLDIQAGGNSDNKFTQLVDKSIVTVTAEDLTGATKIGDYAFFNCDSLTTITIPNSVTSIGRNAFANQYQNYSSLTTITIPNSVTSIESNAFNNCDSLTTIIIPNSVTEIGAYAFNNCSSLNSVILSNAITELNNGVFYKCRSLTTITIPNSVTSIRNQVFYSCKTLTSMRIEATTPPTLQNTGAISSATTQIQVPMASVDAYKTATNWSNFADIIVGYEEETT